MEVGSQNGHLYIFQIISIYSSEGIQIGGIRSSYGVLGSWTTVFHDDDDPVGALLKISVPVESTYLITFDRTILVT